MLLHIPSKSMIPFLLTYQVISFPSIPECPNKVSLLRFIFIYIGLLGYWIIKCILKPILIVPFVMQICVYPKFLKYLSNEIRHCAA